MMALTMGLDVDLDASALHWVTNGTCSIIVYHC